MKFNLNLGMAITSKDLEIILSIIVMATFLLTM